MSYLRAQRLGLVDPHTWEVETAPFDLSRARPPLPSTPISGPQRCSRRPPPARAVPRLYTAPRVARWSVGTPGRQHGNVGGAGHACGARAMTPGAAQKAGGGRGRDRDEILTCRFSWPGRCAWCGGRGGRSRTVSKFAREALQLASEGSQMRLKGGASVGARRGGRLGGAHVLPAYPSYPWDLGASPATSSKEPWLERCQLDRVHLQHSGCV